MGFYYGPSCLTGTEGKEVLFIRMIHPETRSSTKQCRARPTHHEKEKEHMPRKTRKPATKMKSRLKVMGITQTALAKRLKKSVTLVNHFCVHGIKTVRVAKEYSRVLCCRPEELMDF